MIWRRFRKSIGWEKILIQLALVWTATTMACMAAPEPVTFSPPAGTFLESQSVTLTSASADATIYFTTDGTLPTKDKGALYSKPLLLSNNHQIRAVAVGDGGVSDITSAAYYRISEDLAKHRSKLPMLVIDSFGTKILGKPWKGATQVRQVPRLPAELMVFDQGKDGTAKFERVPTSTHRIGIRRRGSFSSTWRQKPYSFELWDESDDDLDARILDLPAHSDWVLYYPDVDQDKDHTMLYNAFIWTVGAKLRRYAPRFRWVEVFVDEDRDSISTEDRRGIYALVEKVSRGKSRLPFAKMSDDGASGGWMVSINRMDAEYAGGWPAPNGTSQAQFFHTAGPNRIAESSPNGPAEGDDFPRYVGIHMNFESPNGYKINPAQRRAIERSFKEFEDALYNDETWLDPESGYRTYVDAGDFSLTFTCLTISRKIGMGCCSASIRGAPPKMGSSGWGQRGILIGGVSIKAPPRQAT